MILEDNATSLLSMLPAAAPFFPGAAEPVGADFVKPLAEGCAPSRMSASRPVIPEASR